MKKFIIWFICTSIIAFTFGYDNFADNSVKNKKTYTCYSRIYTEEAVKNSSYMSKKQEIGKVLRTLSIGDQYSGYTVSNIMSGHISYSIKFSKQDNPTLMLNSEISCFED